MTRSTDAFASPARPPALQNHHLLSLGARSLLLRALSRMSVPQLSALSPFARAPVETATPVRRPTQIGCLEYALTVASRFYFSSVYRLVYFFMIASSLICVVWVRPRPLLGRVLVNFRSNFCVPTFHGTDSRRG